MTNSSLQSSDDQAAAVQKTPNRVTLAQLEAKIESVEYFNPESSPQLTIAIVKLTNGFVVTGESASADHENFDAQLGKKFAREAAIRRMWPFEGYLLCEKLASATKPAPADTNIGETVEDNTATRELGTDVAEDESKAAE